MRIISVIFISALAAVFCGCTPVVSVRPLYTDEDLKHPIVEPRIEGEWVSPDVDKVGTDDEIMFRWKIAPPERPGEPTMAPNSAYHMEFRPGKPDPGKGDQVFSYYVRLIAMGDKFFFDADFDETVEGPVKTGSDDVPGLVGVHIVGRIWVHSDYLRLALLDPEWMKDNAPDTFRELKGGGAIITASTQELRDFLLRNSDNEEVMGLNLYLCHPGTDCAVRALDDMLSIHPNEDDLLKQAGRVFLARGNYDRVIESERRRLESDPDNFSAREDLCRALLFKKDFRAARSEWAATQKSAGGKAKSTAAGGERDHVEDAAAKAAEGVVWSYFIEGDYSGAVTAFANYKGTHGFRSANPILLTYFSLWHLGKNAEAVAFLKDQSDKFKGSSEDQLLLLDFQGRLTDGNANSMQLKGDDLQRSHFYSALAWIEKGNIENARQALESALEVADAAKDGLPALAAKVELERLGPLPKK
jgi:tetratricopeptide (TPR) repeat protein